MGYYGTEYDHYEAYCEAYILDMAVFTIEDYRERMWDAEQDRREVAAMDAYED